MPYDDPGDLPWPQDQPKDDPTQFLGMKEVVRRVCLCESQIRKMIKANTFPAPRKIGARAIAFSETEISAWQATKPNVIWVAKKEDQSR
jgi:prophage regulatory protein